MALLTVRDLSISISRLDTVEWHFVSTSTKVKSWEW